MWRRVLVLPALLLALSLGACGDLANGGEHATPSVAGGGGLDLQRDAAEAMRSARARRLLDERRLRDEHRLADQDRPVDDQRAPDEQRLLDERRRLIDERRFLQGRIQSLDRALAPYERDQMRARMPDPAQGWLPGPVQDPAAERREQERRNLEARDRLLQDRLRWQRSDAARRNSALPGSR